MSLFSRMFGERSVSTVDDYAALVNSFLFNGNAYGFSPNPVVHQTQAGQAIEVPPQNYVGLSQGAYRANGPFFTCELVRMSVFSSVRLTWQRLLDGAPSDFFADPQMDLLRKPWKGGTTQDLLASMLLDADLAGNAYIVHDDIRRELFRLRPDYVTIVLTPRIVLGQQCGWVKEGYLYWEGGQREGVMPVFFEPNEVAHFAPNPDPLGEFRGMSWMTPVINELVADKAMTRHALRYFDNAATPNMIMKYQPGTTLEKIKSFKELMNERHAGVENAWKIMHLAPGADPVPVGAHLAQIDFKGNRGAIETRIAAAAGLPPVIAGFSEGLAAATYSNYSQARRRFSDGTIHPLWENVSGVLENVLTVPRSARLWYDATDVPFLREDEKDAAEIQKTEAMTINTLITAGYEPESVIKAVAAQDWRLLKHTGLMSVQLVPPGTPLRQPPRTQGESE